MNLQPNSALGQLTQMIAHDLNNHLQSMVLHLDLLKPLGEKDEKARKHIARITEGVEHSEGVLRYLRDVCMKDEKDSTTNIEVVVEGIVMLLGGTFKCADVSCERSYDDNLPPVGVSMLLAYEILINVIMNAVEACEHGGVIAVAVTHHNGNIIVEVRDPGSGMSDEDAARAEEPFFTTKGGEHQGLGLTVAHAVLDEHGGSLAFSPAPGAGTTVRVTLPRASHP